MVSFAPSQTITYDNPAGFNAQAYMQRYASDLSPAGIDTPEEALSHYMNFGRSEGRVPFADPMAQSAAPLTDAGVVPMTVEPLHQFERAGLTSMGQPQRRPEMEQASQFLSRLMGTPDPMMQEGAEFLRQGAAPVTFEEVQAMRNPYAQAVQDRLTSEGEKARAAILARQGGRGSASFGNQRFGAEMGDLAGEIAGKRADIDYQTYQDALARLIEQRKLQQDAGQRIGGMGVSGRTLDMAAAGNLFDAGTSLTNIGRQEAQDQIRAGRDIRGYNQRIVDMVSGDILGRQQFEPLQLQTIQSLLAPYDSSVNSKQSPGVNTLETIGGLAGSFGDWVGDRSLGEALGSLF